MRIKRVVTDCDEDNYIEFDNGKILCTLHVSDCCEINWADFSQLDDIALNSDFDEPLKFEAVDGYGFRFGNEPQKMFFVPCYSDQNGYYTDYIEIWYDGEQILVFDCEERS